MPRPRRELSGDQLRLLALVRDNASGPRSPSVLSMGAMAESLGCSVGKVKILRRQLVEEELLLVEERWLPNGGQAENGYRLTRAGRRLLKSCWENGGCPEAGRHPVRSGK